MALTHFSAGLFSISGSCPFFLHFTPLLPEVCSLVLVLDEIKPVQGGRQHCPWSPTLDWKQGSKDLLWLIYTVDEERHGLMVLDS